MDIMERNYFISSVTMSPEIHHEMLKLSREFFRKISHYIFLLKKKFTRKVFFPGEVSGEMLSCFWSRVKFRILFEIFFFSWNEKKKKKESREFFLGKFQETF